MDRTHYRIWNERTGNPAVDNRARQSNRAMSRRVRDSFRVQAGKSGWKRKSQLTKTTMLELLQLHLSVMKHLHERETNG